MDTEKLQYIAKQLLVPGKGILAADESLNTIKKRFELLGIENTEENRRAYREMLFTTPAIEEYISGVILFEETLYQTLQTSQSEKQILFPEFLAGRGIIPGIKVDQGLENFQGSDIEKITKGINDLPERLKEFKKIGVKFAKWRAVINIQDNELPTENCILENAKLLARYAQICQEQDIVPIVEPEVLMDGSHNIEKCQQVTEKTLKIVFKELQDQNIYFPGMLLKPNMIVAGKDCKIQPSSKEIAEKTLQALKECVPAEVAGIVFLSGGQTDIQATKNLNEIVKLAREEGGAPWPITFSYGRALQDSPIKIWAGKKENIKSAQKEFLEKCRQNSLASQRKL